MNSELTPEQVAMASEIALGVLEGNERAEAMRLMLENPAFAAMVRTWQDELDPLGEGFTEAPPPNLWPAIAARLDAEPRGETISQLRFWQAGTALASAMAASLAAILIFNPATTPKPAQPAERPVIAQLAGADGTLLAANLTRSNNQINIRAVTLPDSTLVPELWVIPGDGIPRSLGLIEADGTSVVVIPAELKPLLIDGAVLAVSLEQAEGAPHTAPSSTPIATGKISVI
ncbi:MAG: hypothetical protein C0471_04185 [Erythrobacter sp.]|nr:hypothetical protein [Erythrobacter sp.]